MTFGIDDAISLYSFHLLVQWAMTCFAQTCHKYSNSLRQPFHYLMAGMNLACVLLYFTRCYLIPNTIRNTDTVDLNMGVSGFFIWILKTMRNSGLLFDLFVPYYFSYVFLFNFWFEPFVDTTVSFVRKAFALIFITDSFLVQTHIVKNKNWKLLMELMIITYYFLGNLNNIDFPLLSSIVVAVFIRLLEYRFPASGIKHLIIMIMLIVLAGWIYFWNYRMDYLLSIYFSHYVSSFLVRSVLFGRH